GHGGKRGDGFACRRGTARLTGCLSVRQWGPRGHGRSGPGRREPARKPPGNEAPPRGDGYAFVPRMDLPPRDHRFRPRLEVGRALARAWCVILALVGALPVAAGFLVRSPAFREAVARKTAALVEELVGVEASYSVGVQLFPLELVLEDVRVKATDGGPPAL